MYSCDGCHDDMMCINGMGVRKKEQRWEWNPRGIGLPELVKDRHVIALILLRIFSYKPHA